MTVTFPNATSVFSVPATPTIIPISGFSHCAATATGSGQTVTITLADSTSSCFIANGTVGVTVQILGVTSGAAGAPAANLWKVSTSNDTTAGQPRHRARDRRRDLAERRHVHLHDVSPPPRAPPGPSASRRPRPATCSAGDTITIAFPNVTSVFTVPASPTVTLKSGFKNCAIGNATGAGTVVTITLADNGGTCSLPNAHAADRSRSRASRAGAAGAPTAANWTVKTTADTTAANAAPRP